ncbi:MAG: putative collagen-binding domain-containing protein [Imperialibacter sp.]|uniref:putative collagen-binding domain-containing protein n=1 Tax=Imperialibacter sp. TaxID=2038411 RepID=UPI0032F05451
MQQSVLLLLACLGLLTSTLAQSNTAGISMSQSHPQFWAYDSKPTLLLGGSVEDNLFQIDGLPEHLDQLQSAGGNYVRCTMSSRDVGNVWAFGKTAEGIYDLETWNEAYWQRFETFLQETAKRDIVVQLEVWATFDFYREIWDVNPFNPKNNKNYDAHRSKLDTVVATHPIYTENNFFRSVPSQMSLFRVLEYQQAFVDKLLEHTLKYDHVLYCMDNETSVTSEWGAFWSEYIKRTAQEQENKTVYTTEMWDPWDLNHVAHRSTIDHPEIYDFVDISQNNHNKGQLHWDTGIKQIQRIHQSEHPRPANNIKVYGANGNKFGHDHQDALERFVRNVLLGAASTRFHRPPSGLGLSDTAQTVIQSMRMLTDAYDHFSAEPCMHLLSEREENEAYARAIAGEAYVVYFPDGGEVTLDLSGLASERTVRWLNVLTSEWTESKQVGTEDIIPLAPPQQGNWVALIKN